MDDKKITRKELYDYISSLEKLLLYSSTKTLDCTISSQLVSKNLSIQYKSTFAKNMAFLLYAKETEMRETYDKLKDKLFID